MPELDLSDLAGLDLSRHEPLEPSVGRGFAAAKLIAVMTWPEDQNARNEFLASLAAGTMGEDAAEAVFAKYPGMNAQWAHAIAKGVRLELANSLFTPNGGFAAVATAPGLDKLAKLREKAEPGWRAAGRVLQYIHTLACSNGVRGGASVNKAVWLIIETHKTGVHDKTGVMKAWKIYGPVTHLCAALVRMSDNAEALVDSGREPPERGFAFYEMLPATLALAREYQKFALAHVSHGLKRPLFEAAGLWQVPASLRLPTISLSPMPLAPIQLAALAKYRAPQNI